MSPTVFKSSLFSFSVVRSGRVESHGRVDKAGPSNGRVSLRSNDVQDDPGEREVQVLVRDPDHRGDVVEQQFNLLSTKR